MNVTRKKTKSGTQLSLEGELTIYTVAQAKQALLEDYESFTSPIALELHHVSEIDTAGIQLLLFVHKLLHSLNKQITLAKSNEHVDSMLMSLDVANYFSLEN